MVSKENYLGPHHIIVVENKKINNVPFVFLQRENKKKKKYDSGDL
jgi:hypothetical protein